MIVPVHGTVEVRFMLDTDTGDVSQVQVAGGDERHVWAAPDGLAAPADFDYPAAAAVALASIRLGVIQ